MIAFGVHPPHGLPWLCQLQPHMLKTLQGWNYCSRKSVSRLSSCSCLLPILSLGPSKISFGSHEPSKLDRDLGRRIRVICGDDTGVWHAINEACKYASRLPLKDDLQGHLSFLAPAKPTAYDNSVANTGDNLLTCHCDDFASSASFTDATSDTRSLLAH